jgi:bifunctional non-homologous end joining protein LigD
VAEQRRAARGSRVLVDWLQNDAWRSTVAPYSLRALPWPTVSTPVAWDEVERALDERRPEQLVFGPRDVLDRVDRLGDLFAPVLELEQRLPG